MAAISFFGDLIQTISDRGRDLIGFGRSDLAARANAVELANLCEDLISRRGEASGVALARLILDRYATLARPERSTFLRLIAMEFGADHQAVDGAIAAYRAGPSRAALGLLHEAAGDRGRLVEHARDAGVLVHGALVPDVPVHGAVPVHVVLGDVQHRRGGRLDVVGPVQLEAGELQRQDVEALRIADGVQHRGADDGDEVADAVTHVEVRRIGDPPAGGRPRRSAG